MEGIHRCAKFILFIFWRVEIIIEFQSTIFVEGYLPARFFSAPFDSHRSSIKLANSDKFFGRLSSRGSKNFRNKRDPFDESSLNNFGVLRNGSTIFVECQAM